jgi:aryl-alcohol dehydrogenase-like predicted oxidoreductase
MSRKRQSCSRRDFLKITGAAGAGAALAAIGDAAEAKDSKSIQVPTRPFGNTGEQVSMLAFGGSQNLTSKQLLLRQAFKMGVTYWDTAEMYSGGKSEEAMGKYFAKYPDDRKSIFLVSKARTSDPDELTLNLNQSLERLQTDYLDLFFVHMVKDPKEQLTPAVKVWADKAKATGKIRFFGFSTHKNMENSLMAGARLGWIDGIMTTYNYRLMNTDEMKRAIEACSKAGIGLTAMKTQAKFFARFYSDIGSENDAEAALSDRFIKKGFTPEQTKLKVVWENPAIASICSEMTNMTILQANVAAALDQTALSLQDQLLLEGYARASAPGYCAGCGSLCEGALDKAVPVSDVMRYLMYHDEYGRQQRAIRLFNDLPPEILGRLTDMDYAEAERLCPQKLPIARLLHRAAEIFSVYLTKSA